MQAHAKGALAVRPQQHVAMRGLCAACLPSGSVTRHNDRPYTGRSSYGGGWGSVTRTGYDLDAATEAWERYCGERSTVAAP